MDTTIVGHLRTSGLKQFHSTIYRLQKERDPVTHLNSHSQVLSYSALTNCLKPHLPQYILKLRNINLDGLQSNKQPKVSENPHATILESASISCVPYNCVFQHQNPLTWQCFPSYEGFLELVF